ncbi:MAG: beta strand repeat-containing protein, partial [Rhizomicrobium sp.]
LTVDNVTFQNWNKNAIDAVTGDGSGTNGGTIDLTVTNSNFIGHGDTGTIAQNGILAWEQGGGTVNLTVDGDSFSGLSFNDPNTATAAGVLVYGSANGTVTVSNSDFDNSVQEYISTAGGSPNEIDATNGNTFGGVATSSATLDQLYDIVDKITDGTDDSSNGLVRLVAGHVYATAAKDNIQNAVDVASNNDIINIQAGNYEGQVVISGKALALEGAGVGDTTISAPDLLAHSFSANGTQYRAVVSIEGGADVTVTGLTVDGRGVGDANAGLLGIGIYNSNATIDGVTITRVRSGGLTGSLTGAQGGTGVGAFNDSGLHSVTVENSTINDFQKNGVQFVGKGISAVATNNVITGAGSTGVIAQNGIEIWGSLGSISGATISGNTISDINYSGTNNAATDIILINADNAQVSGNTITGTGAGDTSNGIYVTGSTGVNLIGNVITSTGYGVDVDNGDPVSIANSGPSSVTMQNNVITGNGVGVQVGYDETDTSVVNAYNNDFSGNTFAVELESSSDVANFSGNWWGSTDANNISAMMTGADAALVDFSPFLMSGTDTSAAAGFQGNFANLEVTTLGGGDAARIQEGIADVTAGGTVNLDIGNYTLAGELDITKSLTLKGLSETGTIITSNSTGYGINVTADNVSLQNFTYHGPTAVGSTYGIKVTPDTGVATDRLLNFDIENVTIDRGYRTGLDLNGVVGATIKNVSVSNIVHGNGIALTDSANVTITGASTSNNAWGGLALYQTNSFYNQQLNNIVVDSTSQFHEANGVYEEDQSASLDMGSLSLAGYNYAAIDKSVANDQYTFFQKTEQGAIDFATDAALNSGHLTLANTYVEGWSGTGLNGQFYVGTGANSSQLLIATAVGAASAGNTINVDAGTYAEDVTVGTQLSFNFDDVNVNSFTLGSGAAGSSLNGNLTATGAIASSGAVSLDGDFTAASIALNGATTLTGSTTLDTSAANGDITVASVVGGGKALALKTGTGTSSLGNVANAGSITALGAVTLTGTQYGAGAETFGATTLTGDTTFDVGTGNVVLASVVGGGNDVTVNAGSTSLGNVSNAGAVAVNGAATLTGSAYSGSSFAFGGAVSLTKDTTIGATGAVSLASLSGGGNDLAITGAATSLGNVANAGALSVSGPATLTGTSYVAGSIGLGATTLTGDTTLDTSGSNGAIQVASVGGAHALSLDAGTGSVSLGNVSGLTSLSDASATTLTGSTYNAGSFVFDGGVTLTAATTTLSTNGGDITFNGDIFGTSNGAQSLTLNAGPGTNSGANGDITLQNAGTSSVRLGDMTVSGNDFNALVVWLAGNFNSTLTGNQVFASDTLHAGGNVNSTVGGDASGHIESDGDVNIAAQGDVSGTINGQNVTLSGDDVNASVTATDTASVTGNTVEGSYSADTVSITANNNVDAAVTATDFTLSAQNGSVDGTWTNLDASGSGVVSVNGQTVVGEANFNPAQLVVEGFVLPAGTIIGPNGQLILPQGVLLGLLSPGGGKPKMILVHTVQDLGQLLAEGYSVIVIDLSGKDKGKPIQLASN